MSTPARLDLDTVEPVDRADIVVDLGSSDYDARAAQRESTTWFTAASLAAADSSRAEHVVFVSSAMVYGAFANNPVPLTEEAVLRPDVEFVFARQLASAEELVEQWRLAAPARSTTVLRPVIPVAADGSSRLATAYVSGLGRRLAEDDPPSQFLHLDDLASAITAAIRQRLDGVFNVAPDGWVPGERVRALSGERPRIPLPERAAELVSRLRWQFQRGPIPPGLRSYTLEPWVVANGRLRNERLAADGHQRAGLRRGHRVQMVDDGVAEAPPGAGARSGRGRGDRRHRGRGADRPTPAPPAAPSRLTVLSRRRARDVDGGADASSTSATTSPSSTWATRAPRSSATMVPSGISSSFTSAHVQR